MNTIGSQIKKYRVKKEYTQEKLGKLIGVTTQAVSKWERGGTPDAQVLPLIADALDVGVDALFGREEQDLQRFLTKTLSKMSSPEAFGYLFNICWASIVGLSGDEGFTEDFIDTFASHAAQSRDNTSDYFAKLIRDDGMALARLSGGFSHFFLMAEPKGESVLSCFEDTESLRKIFELFSQKNVLKIICYLYSMSHTPMTAMLIEKGTGLDAQEVERCMKKICDHQLAIHIKIATVDGEIDSYAVRKETCAIPLFCFADELAKGSPYPVFNMNDRKKPLF